MKTRGVLRRIVPVMALAVACGGTDGSSQDDLGTVSEDLAPAGANANPVSNTLTSTMFPGERQLVNITMQNTGTTTWTKTSPTYALGAPSINFGWSYTAIPSVVAPNANGTTGIVITAPTTPGATTFQARMEALGLGFFGNTLSVPITITSSATPQWGCTYLPAQSTVPSTMAPGANQNVLVTVQNTGSVGWLSSGFSLVSEDGTLWNQTTSNLTVAVAPGATHTFGFSIKAPSTPGNYTFTREMSWQYLGDFRNTGHCVVVPITVGGTPALNSTIGATNFVTPMAPGETRYVSVTMNNTGTETWTNDGSFMLFSENSGVTLWGLTQVVVNTATPQNSSYNFVFQVTAPTTPGTYNQVWQMRKTTGTNAGFFGAIVNVPITVSSSATPQYGATVSSQTVPTLVTAGKAYNFAITMQNSGSTAWSGSNFALRSTSSPATIWGTSLVTLGASETVAPNATRLFNIPVTAPATPGTYASSWRMFLGPSTGYFGSTATTNVVVTLCGNGVVDSGETCDDSNLTNGDGCSNQCQWETVSYDLATTGVSKRTLVGPGSGAQVSPVTIGDVTGDGVPEVMTSMTGPANGTGTNKGGAGSIYGFAGGSGFLNGSSTGLGGAGFVIGGADGNDALGAVASGGIVVGQLIGDSIQDLAVSAPDADGPSNGRANCGEVYVITGSASLATAGIINLGATTAPTQLGLHVIGATAGDQLIVLGIGDLTGDGKNDLLLGAPGHSAQRGALYVVEGGSLSGDIDLASPPATVHTILGAVAPDQLGSRAAIGDLDGDGKLDILAGAPLSAPGGRTRAGSAFAKFGPITTDLDFSQSVGSASGPNAVWRGQHATDGLGSAVAIGNLTGTSQNEAIIGAIQYQNLTATKQVGGVSIWSNVTSGATYDLSTSTVPTSLILGQDANDDCGTAIAIADYNRDGLPDVAFGCSLADGPNNTRTSAGEMDIVYGRASLPTTWDMSVRPPSVRIYGPVGGGLLSRHAASLGAGDIDKDGTADLCGGSYLANGVGQVDCAKGPF